MTNRRDTPRGRLRGSVIKCEAPLEPAAEEEDWAVLGTDEPEEHIAIAVSRAAIEMLGVIEQRQTAGYIMRPWGLGGSAPSMSCKKTLSMLDLIGRIEHGVYT